MEVWKYVDYSSLSPDFALSLTAQRWGLDPLPANVVAIPGTWHELQTSRNTSQLGSILPYTCSDDTSSFVSDYIKNPSDDYTTWDERYINVTAGNSTLCTKISRSQPCDPSCTILIEGIGQNTTGPAQSNIVGLTHGISIIISIISTTLMTMGWFESSRSKKRAIDPRVGTVIKGSYNAPVASNITKAYTDNFKEEYSASKNVAHCSKLLREMYKLDLTIWAMENSSVAEIPAREELKDKANGAFGEIRDIVQTWQSDGGGTWTLEERALVDEISAAVLRYPAKRYELEMRAVAKRQ